MGQVPSIPLRHDPSRKAMRPQERIAAMSVPRELILTETYDLQTHPVDHDVLSLLSFSRIS